MTTVLLGNATPLMADGSRAEIGNTITVVQMREGWDDHDEVALALSTGNDQMLNIIGRLLKKDDQHMAIGVLEVQDLWNAAHAEDPPEWVESDDPDFARVLADFFSGGDTQVPTQRPAGWNDSLSEDVKAALDAMTPDGQPPADFLGPIAGGGSAEWDRFCELNGLPYEYGAWREHELLTNGGRDALHAQHLSTSAQPAAFNYMALANSATATTPANTDTTLTGEITTAGGGLLRAQATYAHSAGTNTSTLTKTFTANGSDSLPVTISQDAIFNASSSGTMGYKTALSANATLNTSGDNVAITHTITGG